MNFVMTMHFFFRNYCVGGFIVGGGGWGYEDLTLVSGGHLRVWEYFFG